MTELEELYRQVILDHNKNPRNFGELADVSCRAEGDNPLCGDHYVVSVLVEKGIIRDIKFQGEGCAISRASASVMTEMVKGMVLEDARALFHEFQQIVTGTVGDDNKNHGNTKDYGKLAVFAGVSAFPMRVKCASLVWHVLNSALSNKKQVVSTE